MMTEGIARSSDQDFKFRILTVPLVLFIGAPLFTNQLNKCHVRYITVLLSSQLSIVATR